MQLNGLHHVTAITAQASKNLDYYTRIMGMRLVKKTVNQDDVSAYHLFYADSIGNPGTDLTFFDWPHTAPNHNGDGSISRVDLRVSGRLALEWWSARLDAPIEDENGIGAIRFRDPEGLELALVDDGGAPGGTPWPASPVPVEYAVRGLHAVTLSVSDLEPTASVLTEVMGFRLARTGSTDGSEGRGIAEFVTAEGGPGDLVRVEYDPHMTPNRLGHGGVHHVAFRTPDEDQQLAWRGRIVGAGLGVTPVIDRFYFKSIYFREPGGVLFEIATDGPGFATDEDPAHLGEALALPPFLEPRRAQIEANLKPL